MSFRGQDQAGRSGRRLVQRSTDSSTPPHADHLRSRRQPLDSAWTASGPIVA
ncbi:hypothetical protein STVIR_7038 [Streptomyces viridochromogenes Tue57]|uniref:Uncharacterized protein n=1 Tax=Streptomyces viridochromogenes Tue57 TaxID=1160705 RepID=L8P335_STRVR|nr:hypothetical protein STVIR_7038 [Streptomyces viridochromogenes Tue57]